MFKPVRKVSKIELKRIKRQLPSVRKLIERNDSFINSGVYDYVFISVYDHWLLPEETEQIDVDENPVELKMRRDKFKNFIIEVYNITEMYSWRYKRHRRFHIQKYETVESVLRKCDFANLWSLYGQRYGFLLPQFSAVYEEEFDWTNIIWIKKDTRLNRY